MWERPLRVKDRLDLGDAAPDGPILGARVEHELAKRVLIDEDPSVFFTIPHFDGYAAVLIRLERIGLDALRGGSHRGVARAGARSDCWPSTSASTRHRTSRRRAARH